MPKPTPASSSQIEILEGRPGPLRPSSQQKKPKYPEVYAAIDKLRMHTRIEVPGSDKLVEKERHRMLSGIHAYLRARGYEGIKAGVLENGTVVVWSE